MVKEEGEEEMNVDEVIKEMRKITGYFVRSYNTSSDKLAHPDLVAGILMVCNVVDKKLSELSKK